MSWENRTTWFLSSPLPFVDYVVSISQTLKSRGEDRHPCLAPGLGGKVWSFLPLGMLLTIGVFRILFTKERRVSSVDNCMRGLILNVP